MISVVIPTLNAEDGLAHLLRSLYGANAEGLIAEVIVADGGSSDRTCEVAEAAGTRIVTGQRGRGAQLAAGAEAARGAWLLFLHADGVLDEAWTAEAVRHMGDHPDAAAAFRLRFAGSDPRARIVAWGGNVRARLLALPYGDQGLLIPGHLYERLGGYADLPLFEDVDLVRRLVGTRGRGALRLLKSPITTSPARYLRDGYAARVLGNLTLVCRYLLGENPASLAGRYGGTHAGYADRDGQTAPDGPGEDPPRP